MKTDRKEQNGPVQILGCMVRSSHSDIQDKYRKNPKYWDRQPRANSADPDQMPQSVASDQGLHCLPLIQQIV